MESLNQTEKEWMACEKGRKSREKSKKAFKTAFSMGVELMLKQGHVKFVKQGRWKYPAQKISVICQQITKSLEAGTIF